MSELVTLLPKDLALLQNLPSAALVVGLSGGLDSVVLLHVLLANGLQDKLHALHIHHGLSPNADQWLAHCQALCQRWQVSFSAHKVQVNQQQASLEDAARQARYQVFQQAVPAQGVLVLGHHASDQAETVLFRLLRGTGGRGLAGIPRQRVLATDKGQLLRPLLHFTRADLYDYARLHQLHWVEDESNEDQRFARNRIRHDLLPQLQQFTPNIESQLALTAQRIRLDYQMLDRFADQQLSQWRAVDGSLLWQHIEGLDGVERYFWLQHYLRSYKVSLTQAQLENLDQMLLAAPDKQPTMLTAKGRLMRFQQRLYVLPNDCPAQLGAIESAITLARPFDTLTVYGTGRLVLQARPNGAELLLPNGQHRKLKKWFNDHKIPSWWREHLPYLYRDDELVAIGSLWQSPQHMDIKIQWQPNGQLAWPSYVCDS